jgi:ABC-type transport system involved in multi-copper enzyme maturation permease subunit
VILFDLVRTTRRSNFALMRGFYAASLLAALFIVYLSWVMPGREQMWRNLWEPGRVPLSLVTGFAETFFFVFTAIQFLTVLVLTPVSAAPALAEEKERRTFEFLLATPLTSTELIVGKLIARLSYLSLLVLTGLPVLGLTQLLGGIEPLVILGVYVMTLATLFSVTCLSIACSVVANTSRGAILLSYTWLTYFFVFTGCCSGVPLEFISLGNPAGALYRLFYAIPKSGVGYYYPILVGEYTAWHLSAGVVLYVWAVKNLRLGSRREEWASYGTMSHSPESPYSRRPRPHWDPIADLRPPIRDWPILWKELHAEPVIQLGGSGALVAVIATGVILPIAYVVFMFVAASAAQAGSLALATHPVAAYGGSFVACCLLVGVALKAGGTISGERIHKTWDNLLTSTLDDRTILLEKLLGSILSVRNGWWVLGCLWGLGVLTGGLHPLAAILLIIIWLVLAGLVAMIGLSCSLGARTPLQASLAGLLGSAALMFFPWVAWGLLVALNLQQTFHWISDFFWFGLTPPVTFAHLAFPLELAAAHGPESVWQTVWFALAGTGCYGFLAMLAWRKLLDRFGPATGRMSAINRLGSTQDSASKTDQL